MNQVILGSESSDVIILWVSMNTIFRVVDTVLHFIAGSTGSNVQSIGGSITSPLYQALLDMLLRILQYFVMAWAEFLLGASLFLTEHWKFTQRYNEFNTVTISNPVALFFTTPPRTPRISGLKSQILKPTFLS